MRSTCKRASVAEEASPSVAFNYTTQDYLDHYPGARFVEPGFHYSSDNNQDWETVETLREKFRQVIPGFEVRSH